MKKTTCLLLGFLAIYVVVHFSIVFVKNVDVSFYEYHYVNGTMGYPNSLGEEVSKLLQKNWKVSRLWYDSCYTTHVELKRIKLPWRQSETSR